MQLFGQSLDWLMTPPPAGGPSNLAIVQTGATSFELTWENGDGTNNIEASLTGEAGTWSDIATDVASPQTITADPGTTPKQFFRVYEP